MTDFIKVQVFFEPSSGTDPTGTSEYFIPLNGVLLMKKEAAGVYRVIAKDEVLKGFSRTVASLRFTDKPENKLSI